MMKGKKLIKNSLREVEERRAEKTGEDKVLALAKKLFGKDTDLIPSSMASPLEYDVTHRPITQNAANFDREMATIGAVKETLKRVIVALENGEYLLED